MTAAPLAPVSDPLDARPAAPTREPSAPRAPGLLEAGFSEPRLAIAWPAHWRRAGTWPLPSARCLLLLCVPALLLALSPPIALAAAGLLLLAFALDARRAAGECPLQAAVSAPERLSLHGAGELELELESLVARALDLELALDAPLECLEAPLRGEDAPTADAQAASRAAVTRLHLGPDARVRWTRALAGRRRGRFAIPELALRWSGPLGLARVPGAVSLELEIEIVPGLAESRAQRVTGAYARQMGGLHRLRRRGVGTSFESLAEYTRGDDPRHLDWKASARAAKPIVRRYEIERRQNVVVCCDTGRWMAEAIEGGDPVFPAERLDAALSAACALSAVAHELGDHLGLMLFADRVQRFEPPGPRVWRGLPSRLAEVRAVRAESDYAGCLAELSRRVRRRSLVVLISDVLDPEVSEPLARAFAALAKLHLPLFCAIADPRLERAAHAPVTTPAELHRRTAALELFEARAKTLERMRRAGIDVLEASEASAIPALVERYLQLKRSARL